MKGSIHKRVFISCLGVVFPVENHINEVLMLVSVVSPYNGDAQIGVNDVIK